MTATVIICWPLLIYEIRRNSIKNKGTVDITELIIIQMHSKHGKSAFDVDLGYRPTFDSRNC